MKVKMIRSIVVVALSVSLLSAAPAFSQTGPATKADIHRLEMEIQSLKTEVAKLQASMSQHGNPPMGPNQGMMGQPGMGMQQGGMPMMDDNMPAGSQPQMGGGNQPQAPSGGSAGSMGGGMGDM